MADPSASTRHPAEGADIAWVRAAVEAAFGDLEFPSAPSPLSRKVCLGARSC